MFQLVCSEYFNTMDCLMTNIMVALVTPFTLFAVLVLVAGAGVVWEKNTVGWLVAGAGAMWEKNIVGWLEEPNSEQRDWMAIFEESKVATKKTSMVFEPQNKCWLHFCRFSIIHLHSYTMTPWHVTRRAVFEYSRAATKKQHQLKEFRSLQNAKLGCHLHNFRNRLKGA